MVIAGTGNHEPPGLWMRGLATMTYQRVTTFPLRPQSDRSRVEAIAARFADLIAQQPGHRATCIDIDDDTSQLCSVSVWDSAENARAATAKVRDLAQQELGEMLSAAPTTTIGEVIHDSRP